MSENPFSSTKVEAEPLKPNGKSTWGVLLEIAKYLGSYLLGIVAAVLFTPVETHMGGHVPLWYLYPMLAPIGFLLFYFYLEGSYLPFGGRGIAYWGCFSVGLLLISMEILAYLVKSRRLRAFRPLWIGFPLGFVGTLGLYYTAAASI